MKILAPTHAMEKLAPKNALKLLINGKTFALKRLRLASALKNCTVHSSRSARFCVSGQILLKGHYGQYGIVRHSGTRKFQNPQFS